MKFTQLIYHSIIFFCIEGPTDRKDNPLLDLVHRSLVPSMVLIHAGSDEDSVLRENLAVLKDIPSETGTYTAEFEGFLCAIQGADSIG